MSSERDYVWLEEAKKKAKHRFHENHEDGDLAIIELVRTVRQHLDAAEAQLQAAKAEARDKWKSICGCPMCEHHTSAYALQKDRHDTQAA